MEAVNDTQKINITEKLAELDLAVVPAWKIKAIKENYKATVVMLAEGNYEFKNLPVEMQNKECCEAYKLGLFWCADLFSKMSPETVAIGITQE